MTIASALFAGLVGAGLALGAFLVFHWANHKYIESDSEPGARPHVPPVRKTA